MLTQFKLGYVPCPSLGIHFVFPPFGLSMKGATQELGTCLIIIQQCTCRDEPNDV